MAVGGVRHASGDSWGWGCRPNGGRGLQISPAPGLCPHPASGWPDPHPSHRTGSLAGLAHGGGACPGRAAKSGLGQRRCGREWEALVHPVPLSTAKNKENGEADKGRGRLSISLRGGAAEGGRGPCLTGPSPPGLGPASARGGRAMGCPSPSWARLCVSGGAGLRGGGGRHVGSGCNARGLGDPRGPDPDFPEGATSSRLLWGRGLAHDQGAPPWGLLPGPADQSLDSPWGSTPLLWRPCPRTVNWGQLDHSPQG